MWSRCSNAHISLTCHKPLRRQPVFGRLRQWEGSRNIHEKKAASCSKTSLRIKVLPTDHQAKIETARVLAVSKASYGWAACTPIPKEVEQVDIALRKCSGGLMRAAKHLHNLLLGGNTVFEGVMLDNQRYHAQTWCQYDLAAGKFCPPGLQTPGCLLAS